MHDWDALRRFNKTAEKWRDLAEKRRLYFEDLHQSGRWRYYYTEAVFYRRLGKSAELVELWRPVLKDRPAEPPATLKGPRPAGSPAPKSNVIKSNLIKGDVIKSDAMKSDPLKRAVKPPR